MRLISLVLVVAGVLAYKVTTGIVLPHFAPNHQFAYWQYQSLGKNLPDAVVNIITHPWHALEEFFTPSLKFGVGRVWRPMARTRSSTVCVKLCS